MDLLYFWGLAPMVVPASGLPVASTGVCQPKHLKIKERKRNITNEFIGKRIVDEGPRDSAWQSMPVLLWSLAFGIWRLFYCFYFFSDTPLIANEIRR